MGIRVLVIAALLLFALAGGDYIYHRKSTEVSNTLGWVDQPVSNSINQENLVVSGWALDPEGLKRVSILLDGERLKAQYGKERPDVVQMYPKIPDALHSGFYFEGPLSEGAHTLKVIATDAKGHKTTLQERTIRRRNPAGRWAELLRERGDPKDKFYLLFATSGVSDIVKDEAGVEHGVNRAKNAIWQIGGLYQPLESETIKVGIRVPLLYMRTTLGAGKDWEFDPNFNPTGPHCGSKIIAEDSLNGILDSAIKYNIPVLITLNGGVWADASCDMPEWDVNDHLEQEKDNCQWNEKNEVMPDDFLKTLPGSMAAPELARTLSFNVYEEDYRHYKKRNLQEAAHIIAAFALEHPDLFAGVTLEPDLYLNPFVEGETEKQWYDYNPGTIRQFREWLQGKGPYAGQGPQDMRKYARKKPLSLAQVNELSGKHFASWDEVDPPREFPRFPVGFWVNDPWVREWMHFRRHLVDWHYDEISAWVEEAGIPASRIFSAEGFQAPQGSSLPMANWLDSPVKNYDEAGVSIEGSVPSHGHLGVIIYGQSALNQIRMEGTESLFAMFRKVDPDWGIVEMNTSTYDHPKTLADYSAGYRALREMGNYGARFISPMAWNGSNGLLTKDPNFVPYTSYRNTPLEDAAQDYMISHANLPRKALYWEFGNRAAASDDGWEVTEGGTAKAQKGQLIITPTGERITLSSPAEYTFPARQHDLLVLGISPKQIARLSVEAVTEKGKATLAANTSVSRLRATKAGVYVPLHWPASMRDVKRLRIILYPVKDKEPIVLEDVLFYPVRR